MRETEYQMAQALNIQICILRPLIPAMCSLAAGFEDFVNLSECSGSDFYKDVGELG